MVLQLTDSQFKEATAQGVVLVDFWAPWCGPCRMQSPIIDELHEEMGDKVTFAKVNVDESTETAREFRVMSIPTMIVFKDGQPVETLVGLRQKEQLEDVLAKYM
ncbi:thioredoxin [Carnobacteriaceae bacterium zg-ZUI252]|nr:thioredoxin [Carnobacteriaceae bacterium zg-ZUI252]MBS4770720.1 thioredoxin [Carnobacteriaceae bacterium zg-ZUI240]QTU82467.1 thioredoxin [Carnobacteriaceae bacterium zg-C25]